MPNGHNILRKLNNKVVVDNRDGREYIITINIPDDDDRDKDSTYSLAPRIGKKSAIINKTWEKRHNDN